MKFSEKQNKRLPSTGLYLRSFENVYIIKEKEKEVAADGRQKIEK